MNSSELLKWRNTLGINRETAAKLLRLSPDRYGELERGYVRKDKKPTSISANIADSCILILELCESYSHPDALIAVLKDNDAFIAEFCTNLSKKVIFPELKKR